MPRDERKNPHRAPAGPCLLNWGDLTDRSLADG
jgi:hypothetical protein